jgi:glycosyltransferase involved in cell wall biosynthesis
MPRPTIAILPAPPAGKIGWPWTEESPPLPDTMPDGSPWPRVSIVTPSYNQGQFVEETIRSVLLQGYPNLEYIVMDGGSADDSVAIIHKYAPWLSYVHSGPDGGQAAAIAEGFRHATGDILAWINSDDRYLTGAFGRVARFFAARPGVVFGNGDVHIVDETGQVLQRVYATPANRLITANLGLHRWPQQGCFWRRAAYAQAGEVDASLRFCMDRDLFLRLVSVGPSARIPGAPLADFRHHATAKTFSIPDVSAAESRLLMSRYGTRRYRIPETLLKGYWLLWSLPTAARRRLNQKWGWEI